MAIKIVYCEVCGSKFSGSSNAMYCSNKCKQSMYRALKSSSGFIYKLKRDGVVVYVGQSKTEEGVKYRVSSHASCKPIKIFDDFECYPVEGVNLNEIETEEIIRLNPEYNKRLPSNKSYITVKQCSMAISVFMEGVISDCSITYKIGDGSPGENNEYIKISDIDGLKKRLSNLNSN